jgi:hypothetical protein
MTIHAQFQAAIKSKSKSTAGNERLSKIMGTGCVRVASVGEVFESVTSVIILPYPTVLSAHMSCCTCRCRLIQA